jgi:hypothetical protein
MVAAVMMERGTEAGGVNICVCTPGRAGLCPIYETAWGEGRLFLLGKFGWTRLVLGGVRLSIVYTL